VVEKLFELVNKSDLLCVLTFCGGFDFFIISGTHSKNLLFVGFLYCIQSEFRTETVYCVVDSK
jgi:hypothetical protein